MAGFFISIKLFLSMNDNKMNVEKAYHLKGLFVFRNPIYSKQFQMIENEIQTQ